VLVIIFVLFLESRPELKVWHSVELDAEFTANSPLQSFEDYLVLEKQLFAISLVTNASEKSRDIVALQKIPGASTITRKPLDMKWPFNLYSLSHVALPFPVNDPLYGMIDSNDHSKIQLGNMGLRGERGVLQIPAEDMLRLRWNPFYSYLERRLLEFVRLAKPENKAVLAKTSKPTFPSMPKHSR
jgi:hypothetical protein